MAKAKNNVTVAESPGEASTEETKPDELVEVDADRNGQGFLPGQKPKRLKQVETLATEYQDLKNARMKLLEQEVEAKGRLRDYMKKKGITEPYEFDDLVVELIHEETEDVKVRTKKKKQSKPAPDQEF